MAGAGYKLFATGDVLTAAQVNTYLMQQTVMVFASSAARTSALSGVLAEGMVSYLQDTNTLEVYDGSAWIGATGDITALTAGTGISISSATGPVPTVTNSMATEIAAKGDLIAGTGSATFDNLTVGANNLVLTADSSTTTGLKWAAPDPLTTKGDLFTYSTTEARLAVGNNGEMLVADSSTSTGLRYGANFAAGKNKIINGDFGVWQRGTSFSSPASNSFIADRFALYFDGTGATRTLSQQTFTPGTAPVSGYEGQYFFRYAQTVAGTSNTANIIYQRIEDVRTFAGQSAVLSLWLKADSARTVTASARQYFGSGGSGDVNTSFTGSASVTTSWQRFSFTISVPNISGKTVGTSSALEIQLGLPSGTTPTIDIWGVQLEAGSVATAFQTATGTIRGELAACQRYYFRAYANSAYQRFSAGMAQSTTGVYTIMNLPVEMRVIPTAIDYPTVSTNFCVWDGVTITNCTAIAMDANSKNVIGITGTVASGLTTYRYYQIMAQGSSTSAYIGVTAEL